MKIFDQTFGTLERALDVRLARQNVLGGNLANMDTPGFVPRDVDFAAAMGAGGTGAPGGTAPGAPPVPGLEPAPAPGELPLNLASYTPPSLSAAPGLPGGLSSTVSAGPASAAGIDGNAVDADRTLVALAENALQYGAAAKAISKKLAILRYVASDGTA